jgi:hypothetical protein
MNLKREKKMSIRQFVWMSSHENVSFTSKIVLENIFSIIP